MANAAFNKKRALFTSTLDLKLRKKPVKRYILSIALYGAETRTLRAGDQKHLESFEMGCWRRMEKISWTDHVRNEEVLQKLQNYRMGYAMGLLDGHVYQATRRHISITALICIRKCVC